MQFMYESWVKRLGQWHLYDPNQSIPPRKTLCGKPMIGNNYRQEIHFTERTACDKCWRIANKSERQITNGE